MTISRNPDGSSYAQDWCDVRDIVQGLVLALERSAAVGEVFNLAGLNMIWERDIPWMAEECGVGVAEVRRELPNSFALSIAKARRLLGFEPRHDLRSVFATAQAMRRGEETGVVPCGVRWGLP
jgi:nucleoside-diphosphate-sugar epimerase